MRTTLRLVYERLFVHIKHVSTKTTSTNVTRVVKQTSCSLRMAYRRLRLQANACTCGHASTQTQAQARTQARAQVRTKARRHVHRHARTHIHTRARAHTHINTHTYTHRQTSTAFRIRSDVKNVYASRCAQCVRTRLC